MKTKARLDREIAEALAKRGSVSSRSHSTKSSSYDKDDARRFGKFAFRMERTKAQAVADARAEGFGSWQLDAVEEGWDAERRDTRAGGFAGTSHATRGKERRHSTKKGTASRRTHELFYLSEDQQGGKYATHFERYDNLSDAIDTLARLRHGSITYGNAKEGPKFMIVWAVPEHTDLLYWTDGDLSAQPRAQDETKEIRDRQAPRSTRGKLHGSEQYFNNRFEKTRLKHWS